MMDSSREEISEHPRGNSERRARNERRVAAATYTGVERRDDERRSGRDRRLEAHG